MESLQPPQPTRCLPTPTELFAELPASPAVWARVFRARREIRDLLHGHDRRLLVVVGPCSIHDRAATLEYARRLSAVAADTRDALLVCMRSYFDKPRTVSGWRGLIRDPLLDGRGDPAQGLRLARTILLEIQALDLPSAAELLDPLAAMYLQDLLCYGVIGARTSESQLHRELAAAMPMPIGFKNGVTGNLEVARNGMIAAREPGTRVGIASDGRVSWSTSRGNPDGHLILRGGVRPNYGPRHVRRALALMGGSAPARPILVDCSHGNSGKDHRRQAVALRAVLAQVAAGERRLLGLMLESHLHPGRQTLRPGRPLAFGVSITDGCIGWEETRELLYEAAETARRTLGTRVAATVAGGDTRDMCCAAGASE